MDDYVCKPFSQDELKAVLQRWLPKTAPARQERPPEPAAADSAIPEAGGEDHSPINREALDKISALQRPGQKGVLYEVIRLYLEGSAKLLEELREAVEQGDHDARKSAAHSLKSSSANLGAVKLAELCGKLEYLNVLERREALAELMEQLSVEYHQVKNALEGEMAKIGS